MWHCKETFQGKDMVFSHIHIDNTVENTILQMIVQKHATKTKIDRWRKYPRGQTFFCKREVAMLRVCALLIQIWQGLAACLPGAIAAGQRLELNSGAATFPLGFIANNPYDWQTAAVAILAEEMLGFHVQIEQRNQGIDDIFFILAGCERNSTEWQCSGLPSRRHIKLAVYMHNQNHPWQKVQRSRVGGVLEVVGDVGYGVSEALHVPARVVRSAWNEDRFVLDFFKSYREENKALLSRHFAKVDELNSSDLVPCSEWQFWPGSDRFDTYLELTGDSAGFTEVDGALRPKCHQSSWWLAPTCRANASQCIPALVCSTWGYVWYIGETMQKATFWKMPLAVGSAKGCEPGPGKSYVKIPKEHNVIFFYWAPDNYLMFTAPVEIIFPDYNGREWDQGQSTSRKTPEGYMKIVNQDLAHWAPQALELVRNVRFQLEDIVEMAQLQGGQLPSYDWDTTTTVACEWLQNHTEIWAPWIPRATSCFAGQGMFSETDDVFVSRRNKATTCRPCPPGSYSALISDEISDTAECRPCRPGFKQSSFAGVACEPCLPGTFTATSGVSLCEKCPQGQYQDLLASTHCETCLLRQTTEILGAVSEADCKCERGSFLRDEMCQPCTLGLSCAGGDLPPFQQRGFWVQNLSDDLRLSVYRCEDESHCPEGDVGTCAPERIGRACATCREGFWEAPDKACRDCAELVWWPWVIVVMVLLLASVAALVPVKKQLNGRKLISLMIASVMAGQTIIAVQAWLLV